MKYNKEFKRFLEETSIDSKYVMSYNDWKQNIKKPSESFLWNWKRNLYLQCDRLDRELFYSHGQRCWESVDALPKEDLLKICERNRKTLYKTCKKLDKKVLHTSDAKDWFQSMVRNRRYKFLGGKELVKASLLCEPQECPVCLEELSEHNVYIGKCYHTLCTSCLHKLTTRICPLCRVGW